jgi:phytoene dehydrogenase-like protein
VSYDAVVVGAGFGGLGAALALAEAGAKVLVCETLTYPGGCASTFARGGCRFEAGATLSSGFAPGQLFRAWIDRYGLPVEVEPLEPAVELRAPGLTWAVPADREAFVAHLAARPGADGAAVRRFFALQREIADTLWAVLDRPELLPPLSWRAALAHARALPAYGKLVRWMGRPLAAVLERCGLGADRELRLYLDAVCQITVQCGAGEAEAPLALAVLDYWFRGAAHVRGGLGALAAGLVEAIRAAGGEVRFADRVRAIAEDGGGWRVETRRGTLRTRAVLANLLPQALASLVAPAALGVEGRSRLARLAAAVETGWGAAMLYLVADAPPGAPRGAFHLQLVGDASAPLRAGHHVFLSVSGADEAGRAPAGQRTITASTHVPADVVAADAATQAREIAAIQARMRETIAARAPEWWARVRRELTASPRTFARFTGRPRGWVGGVPRRAGLGHYLDAWPRPLAPGLYLVGDSVFPGQSTLATATGGVRVAAALARELGLPARLPASGPAWYGSATWRPS